MLKYVPIVLGLTVMTSTITTTYGQVMESAGPATENSLSNQGLKPVEQKEDELALSVIVSNDE
jgi:hypothetical protein